MKMVKSLLLGSAAGLVAVAGAQAADLPVKAKPVQYVKICSLYGAGFYYIPGTDTCIKVGGFVRAEVNFNANGSFAVAMGSTGTQTGAGAANYFTNNWRSRGAITADARSQTAYGTLRAYVYLAATSDNGRGGGYAAPNAIPSSTSGYNSVNNSGGADAYTRLYAPAVFIQWAGFTAGKTASFFDFDGQPYSNQSNFWGSNNGGNGVDLFAYTAQLGNGLSASIALESNYSHRLGVTATNASTLVTTAGATVQNTTYGGQDAPDIVGNLRIDQAWGSAQVMAAAHQITYASTTNAAGMIAAPAAEWGYAVGAGLKINLPMIGKGDYIQGQVTYGQGAIDYVASGMAAGSNNVTQGTVVTAAPGWDSVVTAAGVSSLTEGWSITGGFEHNWMPGWKTSLYGAYGELQYSAAAAAVVGGVTDWQLWQVGSRTTWTPVANLDLSVEVMYQEVSNNLAATATVGSNDWVSGIVRAQRNFWP